MGYEMNGYVDVAERIRQLREKHPEAVLRPWNPAEPFRIMEIGGREFIVYVAACYRTPDDPMPAVAVAAEPAIGKTNFTRDSEVMNAETSAWGRCIVAALAADTQKVASLNEVRNRQQDDRQPAAPMKPAAVAKAFGGEVVDAPSLDESYDPTGPVPFPKNAPARSSEPSASGGGFGFITAKQRGLMMKLAREKNLDTATLREFLRIVTGRDVEDTTTLTKVEASKVLNELMEKS